MKTAKILQNEEIEKQWQNFLEELNELTEEILPQRNQPKLEKRA